MALLDAALVRATLAVPPEPSLRALVALQLDIIGPIVVLGCVVMILFEVGVLIGLVEKKLPGQPPDWDDDD